MVSGVATDDRSSGSKHTILERVLRIPAACRAHDPWWGVLSGRRPSTRLTPYRRVVEFAVVSILSLIGAGLNLGVTLGLITIPIPPFGSGWLTAGLVSASVLLFLLTWMMPSYAIEPGPDAALVGVPQVFVVAATPHGRRRGLLAIARFEHHTASQPMMFGFADGTSRAVARNDRFAIATPRDLYRVFRRPSLDISRGQYPALDEYQLAVLAEVWNGSRVRHREVVAGTAIESELRALPVGVSAVLDGLQSRRLIKGRRHGVLRRTVEYSITGSGETVLAQMLRERGIEIYMGANRERPITITNGSGVVVVGGSNTNVTQVGNRSPAWSGLIPSDHLRTVLEAKGAIASRLDHLDRIDFDCAASELETELESAAPDADRLMRATRAVLRIGRDVGVSVVGSAVWGALIAWAGL